MYVTNGVVYIGELTFYHYGGFVNFNPPAWDNTIGDQLDISYMIGDNK